VTRASRTAALVGLLSCGYQPLASGHPFGVSVVTLVPFGEETAVGLSPDLASALGRELAARGVALTSNRADADAVLAGRVVSSQTALSPVAGVGAPIPAYDLRLQIVAWLHDRQGRELWRTTIDLEDRFLPSPNAGPARLLETEANRRRTLLRIAERAARMVVDRMGMAGQPPPPGAP